MFLIIITISTSTIFCNIPTTSRSFKVTQLESVRNRRESITIVIVIQL